MEIIKHFSHPDHNLKLVKSIGWRSNCGFCREEMSFPGYRCESAYCGFYLHKSCAELTEKIQHPLHPHPLILLYELPGSRTDDFKGIICDGCRNIYIYDLTYYCSWSCGFNLHPKCASKQDHEELLQQQTFNKELTLYHFCHKHALNFCNLKGYYGRDCCCCQQTISGSAYCCLQCKFYIHDSCTEIPKQVQHPFHPEHLLLAQAIDVNDVNEFFIGCHACKSSIKGIRISCNMCKFHLHVSCANPNRWASPLKHKCHQHNMYYFDYTTRWFECNNCPEKCGRESFYHCVECDFNLHLECIPIPSVVTVTQKHHHPLTLIDSVKDDNPLIQYLMDSNDKVDHSMDYYCDVCETPGNPKHNAYCCKECIYIAHVECIISEDNTPPEIPSNMNIIHGTEQKMSDESDRITELQAAQSMSKKNGASTSLDSKCKDNEQLLSHPSHPYHKLTLLHYEESKEDESGDGSSEEKIKYCNGCNEVMCFPGYACAYDSFFCSFYLHKSCAELPSKILHPLHPHPLTCSLRDNETLICDGCRDLYDSGFKFRCSWSCGFNLDAKCASKQDKEYHQSFKQLTLFRIYHKHALKLCIVQKLYETIIHRACCCCSQMISTGSSAYCCIECEFFIHESCMEIPSEVHHPFHPQHRLLAQPMGKRACTICDACKGFIDGIKIGCNKCDFRLHVLCANPNRWARALKHVCHEHNMYYFVDDDTTEWRWNVKAFYRCVECDSNFSFECIPIPSVVMITRKHHHPLTLIDSVKQDNPLIQYLMDSNDKVDLSMDYYCDVCETPGNPKHHAYYCKECIYIAHVECIISKEQEGLASKEEGRKDTIHHFCHEHQLELRLFMAHNKGNPYNVNPSCCWCYKEINGPGYRCIEYYCKFFIHDFCCMEILPQLQHPLHPHPLHPVHNFAHDGTTRMCRACREECNFDLDCATLTLSCEECNFDLHSACATLTMKLSIKHECHNHNLYFPFELIMKNEDSELLEDKVLYCNKCHNTGGYFYCCRECDINFHFECIPLPCDVNYKCHTHPLTLTYSLEEVLICDICKAISFIAGHPFFFCATCKCFVHIECAISEDGIAVEVLKYLNPRPKKEQRSSTEDHCGRAELDRGNGNGSERMETLALEREALEEKHVNKESEASLDQKISYLDPATTSEDMNKVDADHDQELKEADDRLLSSLDKSEKAEDLTAEVQAAKTSEEDHDCDCNSRKF